MLVLRREKDQMPCGFAGRRASAKRQRFRATPIRDQHARATESEELSARPDSSSVTVRQSDSTTGPDTPTIPFISKPPPSTLSAFTKNKNAVLGSGAAEAATHRLEAFGSRHRHTAVGADDRAM